MALSLTFHDHIKELRRRIAWVVLAVGLSAGISYALRGGVIKLLQKPLGATLFYTSPAGSFNFILKLSTLIGVFIALPVLIYQLLRFIEPALPIKIKRGTMAKVILSSFSLALGGIAFSYFYMIPVSLHFFAGFSSAQIKPLITANEYLSYVMGNFITFALIFQIPLVVLFINWIKPIKPSKMLRYQRHTIVGAAAISVILPFTYDPISQFIVAIPIIFLFYLSVALLWIANRKRQYPAETEQKQPDEAPDIPISTLPHTKPAVPVPLLSANNHRPALAMDGFAPTSHAVKRRVAGPQSRAQAQVVSRVPATSSVSRNRLSIDGISPSLSA